MRKLPKVFRFLFPAIASVLAMPVFSTSALAQDDDTIEEIITTGTRRAERTASDSAVPIDVVSGQDFENMGTPDLDDMLRTTLPSYNVQRHAIDDAATLVRPATLRGLPPDNALVLVNGKRRHRSGVIAELGGSLAAGSQGPDLAAIPPMAIKQLEILRDGASAQYGSDAIAGVMNFVLQDANSGFSVEARTGEFMEGDGSLFQIAANAGFPLGNDGFANVTVQWREQDPTSRSIQRTDARTLIEQGAPDQRTSVRSPYAQVWGAPEYRDDYNIFLNSAIALTDSQEVYFFGNMGGRETEGGFYFRNPNDRTGVFDDGSGIRAIVDTNLTGNESGVVSNCPVLISPGSGGGGSLDPTAVQDDYDARQALPANCWVLNQVLPGGYTPQFGGQLEDMSGVMGIRGEFSNGMLYDFSGSLGRNDVEFFLNNTWNPSLGPDGIIEGELQRDFDIGSYTQTETNLNADFVLPVSVDAFASDLNFAFGAEWREEQFQTRIGEINSWDAGRFAFQTGPDGTNRNTYNDGVTPLTNLSIGAHGFAGFGPQQAGTWKRKNYAVYVDAETDITENFTLGAAVRFEDFDDFGTTTNGKIAARWAFTDRFAIRGSVSTGFRAPTPGQSNVTKVSTVTIDGDLQQRGQIPPTNPIAMALGAEALEPEDATNYTFGVVWDVTDTFNVTVDYFNISLEDRISQTGSIVISDQQANDFPQVDCPNTKAADGNLSECLQETGVPGAADLNSVSFYTNDFETTTQGIDVVATWALDYNNAGNADVTVAWNWTETEVDDAGEEVSRNRVVDLENFNPQHRGVFTYNHFLGNWRFLARASYYDDWIDGDWSGDPTDPGPDGTGHTIDCTIGLDKCYDSEWLVDLEVAYTFADNYTIVVGAMNVFDEFGPIDEDNLDANGNLDQNSLGSGNLYEQGTPFGQDGGFWYVRLRADFE